MGSTISVCNLTNIILDIALGVPVVMYWENRVLPGQCMNRTVGKVWFDVFAQWHVDDIGFDWTHTINPYDFEPILINDPSGKHPQILVLSVNNYGAMGNLSHITKDNINATIAYNLAFDLGDMLQVDSPGWYLGSDRTLFVTGGPTKEQLFHLVSENRTLIDLSKKKYRPLKVDDHLLGPGQVDRPNPLTMNS